jgi:hypothetical protein
MTKIAYQSFNFAPKTLAVIGQANQIIATYAAQGYDLTLRQLYYQFVSRDLIANRQSEYKRLGSIINDGRLAGLIDWDAITDRTRNLVDLAHWANPAEIVEVCANTFRIDKWRDQPLRVEVWIEKDALSGVFDRVCKAEDIPYFSCRGYTSQSELWAAAMRHVRHQKRGQPVTVLHFGDHDPSGIDMTRDITDRLHMFGARTTIERLALNMAQVEQYNPPPNPAKDTDSRFVGYSEIHGDESWELDALEPNVLAQLVRDRVEELKDPDQWAVSSDTEAFHRNSLRSVSSHWDDIVEFVGEQDDDRQDDDE